MKRVIRGLFEERDKKEEGETISFFDEDSLHKIIRLMNQYSIDENVVWANKTVKTIPNFLDRLSYQVSHDAIKNYYELSQLIKIFMKSSLNDFLSSVELFVQTLYEECVDLGIRNYTNPYLFVQEFNDLLALKTIPFRIGMTENGKIFIDRINSKVEEENKQIVYKILEGEEFAEANEHFTNGLIHFAKRNYPNSIGEAYLTLEKYLKIKVNNHNLDVNKAFIEFKKMFNLERGIFKTHEQKIKDKIGFVYTIRSELKSHSDKKTFDRKDFLEETSRFQLNEVMSLVILLNNFEEKNDK